MEKGNSDVYEKLFNSTKPFESCNVINKSINQDKEKDSSMGDIVIEKQKEENKKKIFLLNYFDSDTGEYKKILVKRLKKE